MTPLTFAAGGWIPMAISQVLAFAALIVILAKLVVPHLRKLMGGRTEGIERTFAALEKETADARAQMAEVKEKLSRADQEAERRMKAALDDAQQVRERLLTDAQAGALATIERARREVQTERDKAVAEMTQQVTTLIAEAAEHLAAKAMNDELQKRLVEKYIDQIEGAVKR